MPDTPDPPLAETILAFDYGLRRIGVAVGQDVSKSASPLGVVLNGTGGVDHDRIRTIIEEWHPARLVVGMPLRADGSRGELSAAVENFIGELCRYELPVETIDERYTSAEARETLKQARQHGTRGRIARQDIDTAAAVAIAERYLGCR